jgi:dolichol-phosphate mannosyltransferase
VTPGPPATPTLSLVIPARDEAESLALLHAEVAAALDAIEGGYEVVFVDDGSVDESPAILAGLAAADHRVRVVRLETGRGQSAALDAGFRAARGEWIATIDADLQNDPADLPRLLAYCTDGDIDVVNGVRTDRADGLVRRASSRVANAIRNRLTGESVIDVGCSLRVMRASMLREVKLYDGLHRFLPTLLRLEGARLIEVPVSHRPRRFGHSKYGVSNRLFTAMADLFAVRWMQRRHLKRD